MPVHHCRAVATAIPPTIRESVWITDRTLRTSFNRFTKACPASRRHGSSIPGPLEAQKRARGRKMASLTSAGPMPDLGIDWSPLESALDVVRKRLKGLRPALPRALDWTPESSSQLQEAVVEKLAPPHTLRQRSKSIDRSSLYAEMTKMVEDGRPLDDPECARLEAILCTKYKNHAMQYLRQVDDQRLCDLFFQYFAPTQSQPTRHAMEPQSTTKAELTPFTHILVQKATSTGDFERVLPELTRYLVDCGRSDIFLQTLAELYSHKLVVRRGVLQTICAYLCQKDPRQAAAVLAALNSTDFASIQIVIRKSLETKALPSKRLVGLLVRASKTEARLSATEAQRLKRRQKLTDLVHEVAAYVAEDQTLGNRMAFQLLEKLLSIEAITIQPPLVDYLVLFGLERPLLAAEMVPLDRTQYVLKQVARVKGLAAVNEIQQSLLQQPTRP